MKERNEAGFRRTIILEAYGSGVRSPAMWVGVTILAAIFLLAGIVKVLGLDPVATAFEGWGFPTWFMTAVGVFEILCAILLLTPRGAFFAGLALILLMMGAVLTHVMSSEPIAALIPFFLAAGLSYVAGRHRPGPSATSSAGEGTDATDVFTVRAHQGTDSNESRERDDVAEQSRTAGSHSDPVRHHPQT